MQSSRGSSLWQTSILVAVTMLVSSCDGSSGSAEGEPLRTEVAEAEPVTVSFDLETPLGAALSPERAALFDEQQATVVAGIAATISASDGNSAIGADDVIANPEVLVADGGEVILVRYTVPDVTLASAFGGSSVEDQVVHALYPFVSEGQLSSLDEAPAAIELGIVYPPNFIPDESDPLRSAIDYNDAIGGGDSRTDRPEGSPWRTYEVSNGPTFYWP